MNLKSKFLLKDIKVWDVFWFGWSAAAAGPISKRFWKGPSVVFRSEGAGGWILSVLSGAAAGFFVGFGGAAGFLSVWGPAVDPPQRGESAPKGAAVRNFFSNFARHRGHAVARKYENFPPFLTGWKFSWGNPEGSPIQNLKGFIKICLSKFWC